MMIAVHVLTPTAVAHDLLEKTPSAKVKPLIPHKEAYISSIEVNLCSVNAQIQLCIYIYDYMTATYHDHTNQDFRYVHHYSGFTSIAWMHLGSPLRNCYLQTSLKGHHINISPLRYKCM